MLPLLGIGSEGRRMAVFQKLNILNTSRQEKTKEEKQNPPMKGNQKHRPEAVTASPLVGYARISLV